MTKFRMTFAVMVCIALVAGVSTLRGEGDHKENPIHSHMEKINDHHKLLRRQARSLQFDESTLKMVVEMQTEALAAMHLPVAKAEKLDAAAKKQMALGFRKDMAAFIKSLLDLEIALLEERKEDAKKLIDDLGAQKNTGHEKYTEETG